MRGRRGQQARSVAFVYGGIAGALLVVLAVVALVLVPPSPPSVAEFSPSAEETIDDAPERQSSRFGGGGDGSCASGQDGCIGPDGLPAAASVTPTTQPRDVLRARVRRCVGDPPRQTEDPQSPPCVNYFGGDNGGATARGVTRDEIRVGYAYFGPSGSGDLAVALFDHVNARYELYGRKIVPMPVPAPGTASYSSPTRQLAAAEALDEQVRPFAAIGWFFDGSGDVFADELARRSIVNVQLSSGRSAAALASSPYRWTYFPAFEETADNVATFACRSLAGSPAEFAGPPLNLSTRKFGIVVDRATASPDVSPMARRLSACSGQSVTVVSADVDASQPDQSRTAIARMRADGVTTLLCVCTGNQASGAAGAATEASYQPEWIQTGVPVLTADEPSFYDQQARTRLFGLGVWSKVLPLEERPFYQAIREQRPGASLPQYSAKYLAPLYEQLLILAAGLQAAGPALTPESFAAGLRRTTFPNPGAGGAPLYQASGRFGLGDHAFVSDFPLLWWAADAEPGSTTGGWCYVARGRRYSASSWPEGRLPFFDRTQGCR